MRPTLDEVAKALPKSGSGAPARCTSHKENILRLLRERGPEGVLGSELYARPELYGRSPRNRVGELRQSGHLIEGKSHGSSDWHYVLSHENPSPTPKPSAGKPSQQIPLSNYMRQVQIEQDDAAPLFAGVRR
jgi:hypothetical protein